MARFNPIQNSFVAGLLSPRLEGRDDVDQYHQGLRQSRNGLIWVHGGWTRRPGTKFAGEVPDSEQRARLIPFVFSVDLAYIIVANGGVFRFYTNEAAVSGPGAFSDGGIFSDGGGFAGVTTPIEVDMPYSEEDLLDLQWAQTGDILYIVHPAHPTYRLTRTTETSFTFEKVKWTDGKAPMLPNNLSETTITVTGVGPNYTLTASASLFDEDTDVGRAVRIKKSTEEGFYEITAVSSATVATATLQGGDDLSGDGATDDWSLGMFSDNEGARAIAFHENRLALGGCPRNGERLALSDSGVHTRFSPDATQDDNAIYVGTAATGQIQTIQWISSTAGSLWVGTAGGEGAVDAEEDAILTPGNARYRARTKRGSVHVAPVEVDSDVMFLQRDGRVIRRLSFDLTRDKNTASDLTIMAEHLLKRGGGVEMAYQQSPSSIIWVPRGDGGLVGWSVEPEQRVIAGHLHVFGGVADAIGTPAKCESVAVIPSPDGESDQVWVIVQRRINGQTKRYVEFLMPEFDPAVDQQATTEERINALDDAWFLDCAQLYDRPVAITGITRANPGVVTTAAAHGLTTGDSVLIRGVFGMTEVNRKKYKAVVLSPTTFSLQTDDSFPVDVSTADFDSYISGGTVRKLVEEIDGLEHLEGETVSISADAAQHPDVVVTNGKVVLDRPAGRVLVGLYSKPFLETQRITGGGRIGTDQGQRIRMPRIAIRLHNTSSCLIGVGPDPRSLESVSFRAGPWSHDAPPPLFSGDKEVPVANTEGPPTVYVEPEGPNYPLTVLAIMPRAAVGER